MALSAKIHTMHRIVPRPLWLAVAALVLPAIFLTHALAEELRLDPQTEGVVVVDVVSGSRAGSSGFQRGDIVALLNGEKVGKTRDLEKNLQSAGRVWRFLIIRDRQQIQAMFSG